MTKPKKLSEAVVDSSAIMSIFDKRPSGDAFKAALKRCDKLYLSAGTLLELSILFIGRKDVKGPPLLDSALARYKISIVPAAVGILPLPPLQADRGMTSPPCRTGLKRTSPCSRPMAVSSA